jgi:phage repressor protein C with HTH and peptisase S24 domain
MNNHIVTQRFIKFHNRLRERKVVKSSRQFALDLDYLPQSLSEILKGRRDVTIELIRKTVDVFHLNPNYLFTGIGEMFMSSENNANVRVLTVVADADEGERILHVPAQAQPGYASELSDNSFLKKLPSFSLPDYKYKVGVHRCFDVVGDTMEPTLMEGDKVVCSYLEPALWETALKDGYVYAIVTHDDVLVKRVFNELKNKKIIAAASDNSYYAPLEIQLNAIREIWYVRACICPFLPSTHLSNRELTQKMGDFKNIMTHQTQIIEQMSEALARFSTR